MIWPSNADFASLKILECLTVFKKLSSEGRCSTDCDRGGTNGTDVQSR